MKLSLRLFFFSLKISFLSILWFKGWLLFVVECNKKNYFNLSIVSTTTTKIEVKMKWSNFFYWGLFEKKMNNRFSSAFYTHTKLAPSFDFFAAFFQITTKISLIIYVDNYETYWYFIFLFFLTYYSFFYLSLFLCWYKKKCYTNKF